MYDIIVLVSYLITQLTHQNDNVENAEWQNDNRENRSGNDDDNQCHDYLKFVNFYKIELLEKCRKIKIRYLKEAHNEIAEIHRQEHVDNLDVLKSFISF